MLSYIGFLIYSSCNEILSLLHITQLHPKPSLKDTTPPWTALRIFAYSFGSTLPNVGIEEYISVWAYIKLPLTQLLSLLTIVFSLFVCFWFLLKKNICQGSEVPLFLACNPNTVVCRNKIFAPEQLQLCHNLASEGPKCTQLSPVRARAVLEKDRPSTQPCLWHLAGDERPWAAGTATCKLSGMPLALSRVGMDKCKLKKGPKMIVRSSGALPGL